MRSLNLIFLVLLATLVSQCRAEHHQGMSEPFSSSGEAWYDMDGDGRECEIPPASCPGFDYEKEFVDLCVGKGGRAKTCGCAMRCSLKVEYSRQKPKPGMPAVAAVVGNDPKIVCSASERIALNHFAENRRPGSDEDRCIEDFLCQGTTGRCLEADIAKVNDMRGLARNGCASEVYAVLCRNGFAESLQCPDAHIKQLSAVAIEMADKNHPARRCTRNVICFESDVGCDVSQKDQAQKFKALLNKDGCEYWLRNLCSLD